MGRSRDWLAFCGAKLSRPSIVEIDANEANSIARAVGCSRDWLAFCGAKLSRPSIVEIDANEANSIARAVGCSRKLIVSVLQELTAKERSAACQSGTFVPGSGRG